MGEEFANFFYAAVVISLAYLPLQISLARFLLKIWLFEIYLVVFALSPVRSFVWLRKHKLTH